MATAVNPIAPGKYTPEAIHQIITGAISDFSGDAQALGGVYYRPKGKKDGATVTQRAQKRGSDLENIAKELKAAAKSAKHLSRTEKYNLGYRADIIAALATAHKNLGKGNYSVDEALKPVASKIIDLSIKIAGSKNIGDLRVAKENVEALERTNCGSVGQVIAKKSSQIQKVDEALTDDTSAPFTGRAGKKEAPSSGRGLEGPPNIPPELLAAAQQGRAAA